MEMFCMMFNLFNQINVFIIIWVCIYLLQATQWPALDSLRSLIQTKELYYQLLRNSLINKLPSLVIINSS